MSRSSSSAPEAPALYLSQSLTESLHDALETAARWGVVTADLANEPGIRSPAIEEVLTFLRSDALEADLRDVIDDRAEIGIVVLGAIEDSFRTAHRWQYATHLLTPYSRQVQPLPEETVCLIVRGNLARVMRMLNGGSPPLRLERTGSDTPAVPSE